MKDVGIGLGLVGQAFSEYASAENPHSGFLNWSEIWVNGHHINAVMLYTLKQHLSWWHVLLVDLMPAANACLLRWLLCKVATIVADPVHQQRPKPR